MSQALAPNFVTPTAQQIQDYLRRYPMRPPPRWVLLTPMIYMGLLVVLMLSFAGGGSTELALLGLAGVVGLTVMTQRRVQRMRQLEQWVGQVQELALLRRWSEALAGAWRLLPLVATQPELHGRSVALIAHCLDQMQSYEAALAAMDYLVERVPVESPAGVQLRVQRVMVQLLGDRLSDADDGLRRLRGSIDAAPRASVAAAAYRLAALIQQTQTHHYADAAAGADTLLADLRPLGVEAGYGHALMALSFHELAGKESTGPAAQAYGAQAARWWSRATLLLPAAALRERFHAIKILIDDATIATAAANCRPPESEGR